MAMVMTRSTRAGKVEVTRGEVERHGPQEQAAGPRDQEGGQLDGTVKPRTFLASSACAGLDEPLDDRQHRQRNEENQSGERPVP